VYVPPETLWQVAAFLPHRSPLWRINRLFALCVLQIDDWDAYMKRIRKKNGEPKSQQQHHEEEQQFVV
jgi:hypothetical protein